MTATTHLSTGNQLLLTSAVLLALLIAVLWTLRRSSGGLLRWRAKPRRMQLVELHMLGPRHRMVLMRVDGREVLIGISPTQIAVLDRWDCECVAASQSVQGLRRSMESSR